MTSWLFDLRQALALSELQSPHIYNGVIGWRGTPQAWLPLPLPLCSPQQLPLPPEETEGKMVLSGNPDMTAEGPFAVDAGSGFLLVTRVLDREEQAEYRLQVWLGQM